MVEEVGRVLVSEAQEVVVLSRGWRQKKTSCRPTIGQTLVFSQVSVLLVPLYRLPQETPFLHVCAQELPTLADTGHSKEVKTVKRGVSLHRIPRKKRPSETHLTQAFQRLRGGLVCAQLPGAPQGQVRI